MRITSIRVEGAHHTRKSFLESLVKPHLYSGSVMDNHSTLRTVLESTRDLGHLLHESDIFAAVNAELERSRGPMSQPGDIDLIFRTKEKPRMFMKTSTEIGNNEGGAVRRVLSNTSRTYLTTAQSPERDMPDTKCIRRSRDVRSQPCVRHENTRRIQRRALRAADLGLQDTRGTFALRPGARQYSVLQRYGGAPRAKGCRQGEPRSAWKFSGTMGELNPSSAEWQLWSRSARTRLGGHVAASWQFAA